MGGRDKHNSSFSCGAFRKAKYEIRRRRKNRNRKARAGKNSFPPTPFLFARPSVSFRFCRAKRGNQGFCSKKVRAAFSNCDQQRHFENWEGLDCSLAPPSAGLASQKPFCLAIKSNGGRSPTRTFLSSRRRFGIAKQFIPHLRDIQFFPFRRRRNTKPVFNSALYGQRRLTTKL